MATSPEYIEFVCDSVRTAFSGGVRYKKMFGEYMIYVVVPVPKPRKPKK
ncbi:MAG: hypothetical protein LBR44_03065 [Clostridiales Family XIII bacterium]|jgi:TfoX/Sxy family transcriptional regulator of competence genes|nr:hypothetical protein [Clostridiales Family XIII bacterium]